MRFRQVTSFDDGGVKSRPLKPPPFHGCEPFFCFTTVGLSPILICFIRVRHGPNSHCFATWGGGEKLFFCFTTEGQTPNLICFSRTGHMAPHACCLSTWGRAPFLLRFTAAGQAPRFHIAHRRVRALFFCFSEPISHFLHQNGTRPDSSSIRQVERGPASISISFAGAERAAPVSV